MKLRRFAVSAVTAAALVVPGLSVPTETATQTVMPASYSLPAALPDLTPNVSWHWWGFEMKFTKGQTKLVAIGYGGTAGWYSPAKAFGAYIGLELAKEYAAQAIDGGNCLKVSKTWGGYTWPSVYAC